MSVNIWSIAHCNRTCRMLPSGALLIILAGHCFLQAVLKGGKMIALTPPGHPGISEVKWCMNRFIPFLCIDPEVHWVYTIHCPKVKRKVLKRVQWVKMTSVLVHWVQLLSDRKWSARYWDKGQEISCNFRTTQSTWPNLELRFDAKQRTKTRKGGYLSGNFCCLCKEP